MKEIKAYIRTDRLEMVIEELHSIEGLTGVSVHHIHGYGRSRVASENNKIVDNLLTEKAHVKLEIICLDNLVEKIIESIKKGAHTGLRADGKIYISPVDDAIRISTMERGETAV